MEKTTLAVETAKFFEVILGNQGATGKGLHEKTSSVESRLPSDLSRSLRRIAAIRNKQVHEHGAEWDESEFLLTALRLAHQLGGTELTDIEGANDIAKSASATRNPPPVRRSLGRALTNEEIASLLAASQPGLTGSELKARCDTAFSEASAAAPYKIHAATNAFIYLARRPDVDPDYRFENLALALLAKGSRLEVPIVAKQLLPMEYLESHWLNMHSQ